MTKIYEEDNKTIDLLVRKSHPYHLVSNSVWPFFTSLSLLILMLSAIVAFNKGPMDLVLYSIVLVAVSATFWWDEVVVEGTYQGHHTLAVQQGITLGVGLFIVSEIYFFLSIFWAFFHSSLAPTIELGGMWPPLGIEPINYLELPLLNTIILLSSGAFVTVSHHSFINGDREKSLRYLLITIILAIIFTVLQGVEYWLSPFTISDGVYGSCFFFGTGFHGIHVIIGTIFLYVGYLRLRSYQITDHHHIGYESAILYWHFVDVVWLFLYISMYWWGS